jgi:hypothetical protein
MFPADEDVGVEEHPPNRREVAVTKVVVDRSATRKAWRSFRCTS